MNDNVRKIIRKGRDNDIPAATCAHAAKAKTRQSRCKVTAKRRQMKGLNATFKAIYIYNACCTHRQAALSGSFE